MDLHDLKLRLQKHFTDGLVMVVGSGLSCAEGLPGMTELANHLQASVGHGLAPTEADHWSKLAPLISAKGLEAALLEAAPTHTLEAKIVAETAALISEREARVVGEVFSGNRILRFSRLLAHVLKPDTGLPIITTNYDRLLEVAIEEAGLGVDTMFVGHFAGSLNEKESRLSFCRDAKVRDRKVHFRYQPRAMLFKPHGSLDWYHRNGRPVRHAGNLPLQRLIITPGLNKFRNGYESPFDRHRERANSAIDRASRLLILGYGFNDDHLETHLVPRIREGTPTLLLTYALSPNAAKLAHECPNVIAIQRAIVDGTEGTSITLQAKDIRLPNCTIWELNSFISEVLEP